MTDAAVLEGTVHGYRAALTDEGLVIYDVPVFAACCWDPGGGKPPIKFGRDWVKQAYKTAAYKQRVENYKPPMHIRHHDPETAANDSVRKAGYFKVRRTGTITLDGKRQAAIYADLVFTDPSAQWEVRTNQLNYRSVEIFDYTAAPIINGLALLDHEAPHLELPMLQIEGPVEDLRTPEGVANANFQTAAAPASRAAMVCFRRSGTKAFVTLQDCTMTKTAEQLEEEAEAREAERIANLGGNEVDDDDTSANLGGGSDDDDNANLEADGDNDDDDADMADGEGGGDGIDWKAVAKALSSGEVMQKDLDMVLDALNKTDPAEEAVSMMPEEEIRQAAAAGAGLKKKKNPTMVALAKMAGRLDAMEAGNTLRDAKDKRIADVGAALKRLKGLPLGANLSGKLTKFHKAHGGEAFEDYVESLAQNTAIEPGDRDDETTAAFKALGGKVPAVAMKFQQHGTEAVELASQFAREFTQLQETGARMSMSEDAYVRSNMKREGHEIAEAS